MLIDGTQLDRPAPPLDDLLRVGTAAAPGEVALVSAERALTWRQLQEEADRLASLMPIAPGVMRALEGGPAGLELIAIGSDHDEDEEVRADEGFWAD
jgi:hypothetical protein